jgi:hypothetical protein
MELAICIGALAAAIALICISLRTAVADPKMQLLSLLMGRSPSSKRPRHRHVRA